MMNKQDKGEDNIFHDWLLVTIAYRGHAFVLLSN
jgi:hypothetical protein